MLELVIQILTQFNSKVKKGKEEEKASYQEDANL
jgi:hypothetical protein